MKIMNNPFKNLKNTCDYMLKQGYHVDLYIDIEQQDTTYWLKYTKESNHVNNKHKL